jgi:hypothetical protein
LAQKKSISINQLIATALAEKMSALDAAEYLEAQDMGRDTGHCQVWQVAPASLARQAPI